MKIDVIHECRYFHTPDGACWTPTMYDRPFWNRYLNVFDEVRVFARSELIDNPNEKWQRVDGENVTVVILPYYVGPFQYLLKRNKVIKALEQNLSRNNAVMFRVGSTIANLAIPILKQRNQPYAVEVVGDPWDVFAPGTTSNPFRPFFRRWFARSLKKQCSQACAAAYVTSGALQKRYPPAESALTKSYSSIMLSVNDFVSEPRQDFSKEGQKNIVTVGSMEFMYKGINNLLDAIKICINEYSCDYTLTLVGDGRLRSVFEAHSRKIGISDKVDFTGQLTPGAGVRSVLSKSDMFVLPSKTEGLPRAMIEAMALGLPCIGTPVGGIPELLKEKYLVEPGNSRELAGLLNNLFSDPKELAIMSAQNIQKAKQYTESEIAPKRDMIYNHLKEKTRESIND